MNDATASQLQLLRQIRDAFDDAGVDWWLFGGWAMDAHIGEVTRDHADIEIFIWIDDARVASRALVDAGFQQWAAAEHPDEGMPFMKDGQGVGLWFLMRKAGGGIVTPGRWSDWPWVAGAFDGAPGGIERSRTSRYEPLRINWTSR